MSEDIEWCASTLMKGGVEYHCRRDIGHDGIHMAESGDSMDFGFYPPKVFDKTWEIVYDVRADLLAAKRRLGNWDSFLASTRSDLEAMKKERDILRDTECPVCGEGGQGQKVRIFKNLTDNLVAKTAALTEAKKALEDLDTGQYANEGSPLFNLRVALAKIEEAGG